MGGMKRSSHILARAQLINLNRKKRTSQPISCHALRQPHHATGRVHIDKCCGISAVECEDSWLLQPIWCCRTKKKDFNGHEQKRRREKKKANYFPLHSPWFPPLGHQWLILFMQLMMKFAANTETFETSGLVGAKWRMPAHRLVLQLYIAVTLLSSRLELKTAAAHLSNNHFM